MPLWIPWMREGIVSYWESFANQPPVPAIIMIYLSTQCFPPDLGGIQSYMFNVADELTRQGEAVVVFADALAGVDTREFDRRQAFSVVRFGGLKPLRRRRKAWAIARRMRREPGVLICDTWKSLEYVSVKDSMKILCLAHGMEFPSGASEKKRQRVCRAFAKAQHILANSHFTANRLNPFLPAGSTAEVFWPGIAAPRLAEAEHLAGVDRVLAGRGPVLLTVSRIEARKGHDKVIAALPGLLTEFPHLVYVIIGDGPDRARLQGLVERAGLESHVCFVGPQIEQQKSAWLARTDLFVMPSRAEGNSVEGFGLVYLEAAWFGLASLAGRIGGAGDAVLDGQTGLLCDSDSVESVTQALQRLLRDTGLRTRLGAAAEQRVKARFMWPEVIAMLRQYF